MILKKTPVIDVDFYKTTQPKMYDPAVKGIFSYGESRGGKYDTIVFFGLQGYIKSMNNFFVTKEDVDYADMIISGMGGFSFDRTAWDIVVNEYDGYPPIIIRAVKEGTKLPNSNICISVEANDERLISLVGYFETALLRACWFSTTIASRTYKMRKNINALYDRYADTSASADFSFLDFSARGVESFDASAVGTAAFLCNFSGTDTVAGVAYAYEYYGGKIFGYSVAASEHSVMCSYGKENEKASFERLVDIHENQTLSVVSDTWNIYEACEYWNELAPKIKEKNISLVIRPDSGEPKVVIVKMLEILQKGFSTHLNDKGLKVFDNLKILWGDGVDEKNYMQIYDIFPKMGFGVENLILGSGGGLMQKVNRDTSKWAFKASAVYKNKTWIPISKSPITDPGKKSKRGRLTLIKKPDGTFHTVDESLAFMGENMMEVVYTNGKLVRDQTMEDIRALIMS